MPAAAIGYWLGADLRPGWSRESVPSSQRHQTYFITIQKPVSTLPARVWKTYRQVLIQGVCYPKTPAQGKLLNCSSRKQEALTQRALELLALPDDDQVKLLLDVGCGSGLSGQALTEKGHVWVVSNGLPAGHE